jgi:hypothetical protein
LAIAGYLCHVGGIDIVHACAFPLSQEQGGAKSTKFEKTQNLSFSHSSETTKLSKRLDGIV